MNSARKFKQNHKKNKTKCNKRPSKKQKSQKNKMNHHINGNVIGKIEIHAKSPNNAVRKCIRVLLSVLRWNSSKVPKKKPYVYFASPNPVTVVTPS